MSSAAAKTGTKAVAKDKAVKKDDKDATKKKPTTATATTTAPAKPKAAATSCSGAAAADTKKVAAKDTKASSAAPKPAASPAAAKEDKKAVAKDDKKPVKKKDDDGKKSDSPKASPPASAAPTTAAGATNPLSPNSAGATKKPPSRPSSALKRPPSAAGKPSAAATNGATGAAGASSSSSVSSSVVGSSSVSVRDVDLKDIERGVNSVISEGRTPLILDASGKVDTFYSYNNAHFIDGKCLFLRKFHATIAFDDLLEECRKKLVTAMKLGQPLIISLTDSATDFMKTFNSEGCFPTEKIFQLSELQKEANWSKIVKAEDKDNGTFAVHKDFKVLVTSYFYSDDYEFFLGKSIPLRYCAAINVTGTTQEVKD